MNIDTGLNNKINETIDEESSLVKNILSGNFKVEHSSHSLDSEEFKDSGHLASRYSYELTVPSPADSSKEWTTSIYIYHPNKNYERFEKIPDFRIKILTGQGEMELTPDIKVREMVFKKIAEQINLKDREKDEYTPSRHFSFDGFLEMIEFLESHSEADKIPNDLWVARKQEIIIDDKYWLLMSETLRNFQKTIYGEAGKADFNNLLNRVKKVNPSFNFIV